MLTLKQFILSLTLIFVSCSIFAGTPPIKLFQESEKKQFTDNEFEYTTLTVDESIHSQIYNSRSSSLTLEIPYLDRIYTVELYAFDLLTPDFKLMTNNDVEIPYTPGVYYRGVIAETGGMVALSFFENDIMGILATKKGKMLNLGKPTQGPSNEYVIYNANDVKSQPNMDCHTEELPEYADQLESMYNNVASSSKMGDCVNVYVEGDHTLNIVKGGVVQATDYITGLWGPVTTIFDNESIDVNISEIFVWDEPDGYSTSSSTTALNQFKDNNPTYNGDLAHLMALGGNGLGGVAYVNVICSNNFGYAYSNINANYNSFPSYSWTINVVTHEFGHNLGSPHTHACAWNGNSTAIDGCGTQAGAGEGCDAALPDSGTIMSYCHLIGGVGINFNNGFGDQPGDLIRDNVSAASCLGSCTTLETGDPPIADFDWDIIEDCASEPAQVNYFDESEDQPTEWFWTFPGGDPATSTDQNPVVTYDTPGTYDATLEVTNAYGDDEITYQNVITVQESPNVVFTTITLDNIVFTDNLSQFSLNYQWDFGDGFTSSVFEPSHTYLEDGTYTITLEGFNNCGSDVYSEEVVIATAPTASFTMTNGSGCVDWTVDFTSTSSNNTDTYLWDFPGGTPSTSTDPNPQVTYATAGVFDVSLTVSNETGTDTETMADVIVLADVPSTAFTYMINEGEVTFTNTTEGDNDYVWDFGDGSTSTIASPVYTYLAGGTYDVSLIATNFCGNQEFVETVTIELEPEAGFSYSNPEGCAVHSVQYTDESIGAETYFWEFEGGFPSTSTDPNPLVDYDTKGVYETKLTVTNEYGESELILSDIIIIDDVANAVFTFTENEGQVDFTNLSFNGNSYFWSFGDGNTSTAFSPSHTYTDAGEYLVTLVATNDCGDSQYIAQVVAAIQPIATFDNTTLSGCATHTVAYTYTGSNESALLWTFPGGNPSTSEEPNPIVEYAEQGMYSITLYVSNDYGDDELILQDVVTIDDVPNVDFTFAEANGVVEFTNLTTNGTNPIWDFGDGNTSTDENPTHTYEEVGNYLVTLSSTNDCGASQYIAQVTAAITPIAAFDHTELSGCAIHTVDYTYTGSNESSLLWTFPGGNPSTSTAANPSVTYDTAGSYSVTLSVENEYGEDEVTLSDAIEIEDLPSVSFTYFGVSGNIEFTNTSTNGSNPIWDFGDGSTSTDENPTHNYDSVGDYTVSLTMSNDCGSVTDERIVTVTFAPTIQMNASATSSCIPANITFEDQSINAEEISWEFPGGNPSVSTDPNPTVNYAVAGTYDVILTASNSNGTNLIVYEDFITIIPDPTSNFNWENDGVTYNFNFFGEGNTVSWDFGDGNDSTVTDPSHSYAVEGTYDVTAIATNECGQVSLTQTIDVYTPPTASFSVDGGIYCIGDEITINNSSSDNVTEYLWTIDGQSYVSESPSIILDQVGVYPISLTVSNPLFSDTALDETAITVIPEPTAQFNVIEDGLSIQIDNESTDASNYLWDFGDGSTSVEENPTHTYVNEGLYTVTLETNNICGSSTQTYSINNYTSPSGNITQNKDEICINENIRYFSNASDNTVEYAWDLPGATPSTSTLKNPLVTYTEPGTYSATLTVTNPGGSESYTINNTLIVRDQPTAAFTQVNEMLTSQFTNESLGGTSYLWDFGDGNTSTQPNPTHTYESEAFYTVTLVTTNLCGTNTETVEFHNYSLPSAAFGQNKETVCVNKNVRYLEDASDNTLTYEWIMPGATPSTSTLRNPIVTYAEAGEYDVTLIVTNPAGSDETTQTSTILVTDVPDTEFSFIRDLFSVSFSEDTNGETDYFWDFGDGNTSTEANPVHTYQEEGQYTVTLTTTNDCGQSTAEQNLTINTKPTAAFTLAGGLNQELCLPSEVTYQNQSSSNVVSQIWTFEGGTPNTSTEDNPTVSYSTPGVYATTLEVFSEEDSDIITVESVVTIRDVPSAGFTVDNSEIDIIGTDTSTDAETITWYVNGQEVSTDAQLVYAPLFNGNYTITQVVSNDCGESELEATVTVTAYPDASFTSTQTEICQSNTVTYQASFDDNLTYNWTFEGGTPTLSTDQNPTITYDTPGTYPVELLVTNLAGESEVINVDFVTVTANPIADVDWSIDNDNLVTAVLNSTQEQTYTWTVNGDIISMDEEFSYQITEFGTYQMGLTVINDCGEAVTEEIFVYEDDTEPEGPADLDLDDIMLVPNPAIDRLNILSQFESFNRITYTVIDMSGKYIMDGFLETSDDIIDLTNLPSGVYIVSLNKGDNSRHERIVVAKN